MSPRDALLARLVNATEALALATAGAQFDENDSRQVRDDCVAAFTMSIRERVEAIVGLPIVMLGDMRTALSSFLDSEGPLTEACDAAEWCVEASSGITGDGVTLSVRRIEPDGTSPDRLVLDLSRGEARGLVAGLQRALAGEQ